ncbi:hypothetical protein GOODEAATRI_008161 [Goodea atripinnis]|uniref:Alpha-type protein kinase domain-containing protein n=1 Tax=Goodea atripinnis TaxID=208336 RepID=A0ABV0NIT3_9TELE
MPDPWAQFHLEEIETEPCIRYSKKLSNFLHSSNWKSASNYVAKRYMETVDREVYFEDVRLQMEAKLWGEEYNRHRPPKQVEEKPSVPGKPLFHLEHYIEGKYIKYNSNSGFVRDDNIRLTPQKSAKTVLRGCEEVCGSPRVRTWSAGRVPPLLSRLSEPSSVDESASDVESIPCSPLSLPFSPIVPPGSMVKSSSGLSLSGMYEHDRLNNNNTADYKDSESGGDSGYPSERRSEGDPNDHVDGAHHRYHRPYSESDDDSIRRRKMVAPPRVSTNLNSQSPGNEGLTDDKWSFFHSSRAHVHRPSCVATEVDRLNSLVQKKIGQSILGKVHLAMVRYHEAGRFCEKDEQWDQDAAMFHLERAALCGELEAIVALGKCYLQLPHHILPDMEVEDNAGNRMKGFKYLLQAAEAGDRSSMIIVARAFDTGVSLSADRKQDWAEAIHWYDSALNMMDYDEGGEFDGTQDEPRYLLLAREAEMYQEGGFNLTADPQKAGDLFTEAAEAAIAAMKGRLANQYYMKAEEAWALVEE